MGDAFPRLLPSFQILFYMSLSQKGCPDHITWITQAPSLYVDGCRALGTLSLALFLLAYIGFYLLPRFCSKM